MAGAIKKAKSGEDVSSGPSKGLGRTLKRKGLTLAVAESCTGGLVSHLVTNMPGSSAYFLGGVVAYGNDVKKKLLGVKASTLRAHGAVSEETALEMASGVRKRLGAGASIAVTGIAGPGGAVPGKPVGTVWIAVSAGKVTTARRFSFKGERAEVKTRSALSAIAELERLLGRR